MVDPEPSTAPFPLYTVRAADPGHDIVDPGDLAHADQDQIDQLMEAIGHLRLVERELAEAARAYMQLNETDMRALHYLLVAENQQQPVTATALARHLRITTASTTKLIDRLERQHHVVREPHPTDRRALLITVAPKTRAAAIASMGRHQASRVHVAAALTAEERDTVIRFLQATTAALRASLDSV